MKRIHFPFLVLFALCLCACQDNNVPEDEQISDEQKTIIIEEALQSAILDDLLKDIDIYSALGEGLKSADMGGCPAVTIEKPGSAPFWPRTITLDFGDGCEHNGKVKSGKMIIVKSGPWHEADSKRTISFENYVVDGMSINGNKEIKNITTEGGNATFKINAELDLAWVKNDTLNISVHREINKTQEWIFGFRDRDVRGQVVLNGNSDITRSVNGETKTIKKTYNDISILFGCRFPQSGTTNFDIKSSAVNLKFTLDYATSAGSPEEKCSENCDCMATLIMNGHDSVDIDLAARWRKWLTDRKKQDH